MPAKDLNGNIVETESGPLVRFESQDPRGFSAKELDLLIIAAKHWQAMLIERGNRELDIASQEQDVDSLQTAFEDQQSKRPVDS